VPPGCEIVSIDLPALRTGQILVRNIYMSIDAHMQRRFGSAGSTIGQLARLEGCYVVGAARSGSSAHMLVHELGFDAALDGETPHLAGALEEAFPGGIGVYFGNVAGARLEPVLAAMRDDGRLVSCGSPSAFAEPAPLRSSHDREPFSAKQPRMKAVANLERRSRSKH
jgi:NADPH-dependent curcumin reductase CurA